MRRVGRSWLWPAPLILLAAVFGRGSGRTTAVSLGVKMIGSAVDTADVKKYSQELIGHEAALADETFGERVDTLRDTSSDRIWQVYPAKLDRLGKDR